MPLGKTLSNFAWAILFISSLFGFQCSGFAFGVSPCHRALKYASWVPWAINLKTQIVIKPSGWFSRSSTSRAGSGIPTTPTTIQVTLSGVTLPKNLQYTALNPRWGYQPVLGLHASYNRRIRDVHSINFWKHEAFPVTYQLAIIKKCATSWLSNQMEYPPSGPMILSWLQGLLEIGFLLSCRQHWTLFAWVCKVLTLPVSLAAHFAPLWRDSCYYDQYWHHHWYSIENVWQGFLLPPPYSGVNCSTLIVF